MLAEVLGIRTAKPRLFMRVKMEDDKIAKALFEDKAFDLGREVLVALHPGAGAPAKQWGTENFAETARALVRGGARVLVLGGIKDREAALAIKRAVPEVVNVAGKTGIRQMAALVARCGVFVGNDSGPGHVAAAMGVPVVLAYSGAGDSREGAPYGVPSVILTHPVPCSPCEKAECPLTGDDHMKCLRPVTPAEVAEAALRLARLPKAPSRR
jgi:ADP-heptose:LPS heptosyltransferase